jgi:hypothetical protein
MQRFQNLNDAEVKWIASRIEGAKLLISQYSPGDVGQPINASVLDRAYARWLASTETNSDRINDVLNAVGVAFGQLLVDEIGFQWVVVTDQFGTDMGIRALPGKGDVLVTPTNMVAKRWETRETGFLAPLHRVITDQVRDVEASWKNGPSPTAATGKRPWWRFW